MKESKAIIITRIKRRAGIWVIITTLATKSASGFDFFKNNQLFAIFAKFN